MDMLRVPVGLPGREYDIFIGPLAANADRLAGLLAGRRLLLVADSHTAEFSAPVLELLRQAGAAVSQAVFPAGEAAKTFDTLAFLCREAARHGCDRGSLFAAFGGGVAGDLAGFAAAVYMRGVDFLQLPTSLLAMVDSSVGGKTGVDLPEGKNLAGAFHQPKAVLIDPVFLQTLPRRELVGALAEVVKYGVLGDEGFFAFLEERADRLTAGTPDPVLYAEIIRKCCAMKAEIVRTDERESAGGRRALLNYGHTFGHAAELLSDFRLSHGEAVAIGMRIAGELALRLGRWSAADQVRQRRLLTRLGLPTALPREFDAGAMLEIMGRDKKAKNGVPVLILPSGIGRTEAISGIAPDELIAAMEASRD